MPSDAIPGSSLPVAVGDARLAAFRILPGGGTAPRAFQQRAIERAITCSKCAAA